jgi:hypothetical protein
MSDKKLYKIGMRAFGIVVLLYSLVVLALVAWRLLR